MLGVAPIRRSRRSRCRSASRSSRSTRSRTSSTSTSATPSAERQLLRLRAVHPAVPAAHRRPDHPLARHHRRSSRAATQRIADFAYGVRRFMLGLGKKVLIANTLGRVGRRDLRPAGGQLHDAARLARPGLLHAADLFRLLRLFRHGDRPDADVRLPDPRELQLSRTSRESIREFWRRWHISLSNWFRDYLYVPLGGNRRGTARAYANLVIVFLLCGLWHGASWTFVLWGIWHGVFLVAGARRPRAGARAASDRLAHVYTLAVVMGGWVLFRSDTSRTRSIYYAALLGLSGCGSRCSIRSRRLSSIGLLATTLVDRGRRRDADRQAHRRVAATARCSGRARALSSMTADSAWLVAGVRRVGGIARGRHLQPVHLFPVLMRTDRNAMRAIACPCGSADVALAAATGSSPSCSSPCSPSWAALRFDRARASRWTPRTGRWRRGRRVVRPHVPNCVRARVRRSLRRPRGAVARVQPRTSSPVRRVPPRRTC